MELQEDHALHSPSKYTKCTVLIAILFFSVVTYIHNLSWCRPWFDGTTLHDIIKFLVLKVKLKYLMKLENFGENEN